MKKKLLIAVASVFLMGVAVLLPLTAAYALEAVLGRDGDEDLQTG